MLTLRWSVETIRAEIFLTVETEKCTTFSDALIMNGRELTLKENSNDQFSFILINFLKVFKGLSKKIYSFIFINRNEFYEISTSRCFS